LSEEMRRSSRLHRSTKAYSFVLLWLVPGSVMPV
jgi:hypothetical protein